MTAIAHAPEYGSPAWVADRRHYIGASDVPQILGLSPFGSAYDVWLSKRGISTSDETAAMRWGHLHEPNIAMEYQRAHPDVTLEQVGTLPHPEYPWLRATVDRLVHRPDGIVHPLEIKSTSEYLGRMWGEVGTDDIPDHVLVQAQVQLMVLGLSWGHVAVLVGHSDCRLPYLVEADRELQQMIVDACHDFWHTNVDGGVEPEISGPNTERHLKRKHQTHTDVVRDVDGGDAMVLAEYFATKAQREALEAIEQGHRAQLMKLIGDDYGIRSAAGKVIWYGVKGRTSVDTKGLLAHLKVPDDVLQSYTKLGAPSRTFRGYPAGD